MGEIEKKEREEIFSKVVRAGKRTYFFDVKSTRSEEYYLTITESKKRFNNEQGKFYYEKHKLFLYKEDFDKFADGLKEVVEFIRSEQPFEESEENEIIEGSEFSEVNFEDLGSKTELVETKSDDDSEQINE